MEACNATGLFPNATGALSNATHATSGNATLPFALLLAAHGAVMDVIEQLPPDIQPQIKLAVTMFLTSLMLTAPPALLYWLYSVWRKMRYFSAEVTELTEAFAWVELYMSKNDPTIARQTQVSVRLSTEAKSGKEDPWSPWGPSVNEDKKSAKVLYEMVEGADSPPLNFPDARGNPRWLRVVKSQRSIPRLGKEGSVNVAMRLYWIEAEVAPLWRFWAWGDRTAARELVLEFIDACRAQHKLEMANKLEIYVSSER